MTNIPYSTSSNLKKHSGLTPSSLHSSSSSPSLDRLGLSGSRTVTGSGSGLSLSSMSKLSSTLPAANHVGSVYDKVYRALEFLSVDPNHIGKTYFFHGAKAMQICALGKAFRQNLVKSEVGV